MSTGPAFTVFTPTFNRASTLVRVYASLQAQTFRDFEWLIVDDGSVDGTEQLVQSWQNEAEFKIRYFWQTNGGKHRAFNRGVQEARGELFLTLDSDDTCSPEALARLKYHWDSIPLEMRSNFSAVTALCGDGKGNVIGDRFPADVFDSDTIACRDIYRIRGDKWGFQYTDILRQYPFPEIPGERFVAESIVWNRIARCYRTRYVNEVLKIVEYRGDGLSASSARLRAESPLGARLYYSEYLQYSTSLVARLKAVANYVRFSLHGKIAVNKIFAGVQAHLLVVLCLGVGLILYFLDRRQMRNRR